MRTTITNTMNTTVNTIIADTIIVPTINTNTILPIINDEQIQLNLIHQDEQEEIFL